MGQLIDDLLTELGAAALLGERAPTFVRGARVERECVGPADLDGVDRKALVAHERLEALPWATKCIECKRLEERG